MCTHLACLSDERETGVDEPLEHGLEHLDVVLAVGLGQRVQPRPHDGPPAQGGRLQVHHTAPAHGRRLQEKTSTYKSDTRTAPGTPYRTGSRSQAARENINIQV